MSSQHPKKIIELFPKSNKVKVFSTPQLLKRADELSKEIEETLNDKNKK